MSIQFFTSLVWCVSLISLHEASDILFQTTTSSILPPVTKNFTLKCSLQDSGNSPVIGRRDLTHTDDDVMYVTSIVVTHNGADIATISEHVPAQVLSKSGNMKVSGQISSNPNQRGYIQMDWTYPTDSDAGEYQCDVTGVNKKGHSFVFTKTLEVTQADVTISDLSAEIAVLKKANDALHVDKTTMQGLISTMQGQISTMTSQISSLTSEKNSLKTRMSTVETRSLAQRSVRITNCHWTSWLNSWDAEFSWAAPSNSILVGMHSYHDNGKEDRRFMFYYCQLYSPHP